MQKLSTIFSPKGFVLTLLCWFLVGFSAGQVKADNLEISQLEVGKTYTYSAYQKIYASYTASSSGLLTLRNNSPYGSFLNRFGERYQGMQTETLQTAVDGVMEVEVKAGQTYYFYGFMMDGGSFTVEFSAGAEKEVEIISITPAEGEALEPSDGAMVAITTASEVRFDKAEITAGSHTQQIDMAVTSGRFLSAELSDLIIEWMDQGWVNTGDEIILSVYNLRDRDNETIKYNGDGTLTVKYKCGSRPVSLVKVEGADLNKVGTVKSYYLYTDPEAQIALTFDGELMANGDGTTGATWSFGDIESGDYYTENLPVSIEGNTLKINLAGKCRRIADMLPNTDASQLDTAVVVNIKVNNVRAADGSFVKSTQPGSVGSFSFSFKLQELNYSIASAFTPAGGNLPQGDEIEIWIQGGKWIVYDGVDFEYTSAGEQKHAYVTKDHIRSQEDPMGENGEDWLLYVPVPKITADIPSKVKVSLYGLQSLDGLDHSADIQAEYDAVEAEDAAMQIISSSPADGATLEAIEGDDYLRFSTNLDSQIGYMEFDIYDTTADEIIKSRTPMDKTEDGWEAKFYYRVVMSEGHVYQARISGYATEDDRNYGADPLGTATLTWNGATKAFEYSDITLVSVTPEPTPENDYKLEHPVQITSEDDNTIVVTFSGGVDLEAALVEGYGMTMPLESCTPNEDKTQWTLVIPKSYIASSSETITITMNATDAATGKRVKGDYGEEDQSFWSLPFACTVNVPEITVEPSGEETLETLQDFVLGYKGGISPSYLGGKSIKFYNKTDRTEVASVSYSQIEFVIPEGSPMDYVPEQVKFSLDEPLADGSYYMVIPRGMFILGVDMMTNNNKETIVNYVVGTDGLKKTFAPTSVTPDPNVDVTSLKEIKLHMPATFSINEKDPKTVTVTERFSGQQVATGTLARDEEDPFMTICIELDKEITAEGTYMVVIPEEAFGDDEYGVDFTTGNCNDKLIYAFGVASAQSGEITVTPADGSHVEELSSIQFAGPIGYDYFGSINIKNENGDIVATVPGSEIKPAYDPNDPFADALYMEVVLETPITEDGVYTVEVPDGFFFIGEYADYAPGMTLTYYVGDATAVSSVQAQSGKVTVYTVSGQLIYRNADPSVIKNLHKGIYIINGKKYTVK